MVTAKTIIFILALILLILEAIGVKTVRVNLGWLGLALWLLGTILA